MDVHPSGHLGTKDENTFWNGDFDFGSKFDGFGDNAHDGHPSHASRSVEWAFVLQPG